MLRPRKKIELYKYKGCKDCTKDCLYNTEVAIREVAERNKSKFPCNLSIGKVWVDKTFKEEVKC